MGRVTRALPEANSTQTKEITAENELLRWNNSKKTLAFFAVYLAKKASGVYGRNSTGRFE
mgnify:CR=1 FL=1